MIAGGRGDLGGVGVNAAMIIPFAKDAQGALKGGKVAESIVENSAVTEGIYEFVATTGKVYVGQSGNLAARLEQHIAKGLLERGTLVKTKEVLGGKTAREIAEQLRIRSLGGVKMLQNERNPIGKAREYLLSGL